MAPVMAFMAVTMFWKMHLANVLLSSSEKPRPWMILICRMKVVFPLSPVPEEKIEGQKMMIADSVIGVEVSTQESGGQKQLK